jgi:hypothetical protein
MFLMKWGAGEAENISAPNSSILRVLDRLPDGTDGNDAFFLKRFSGRYWS